MANTTRRPKDRTLTLNVRVPAPLLDALDRYASKKSEASVLGVSRGAVARHLLERILDHQADDRRLASLRSAILTAIASEAERTGTATLWHVRQRLAAIPRAELDRALIALEDRGALVLAPRPRSVPEMESDIRGALWCSARGPLSRVQLPVPQSRLGQGEAGARHARARKRRWLRRTG